MTINKLLFLFRQLWIFHSVNCGFFIPSVVDFLFIFQQAKKQALTIHNSQFIIHN